jgi:hypothetical protein
VFASTTTARAPRRPPGALERLRAAVTAPPPPPGPVRPWRGLLAGCFALAALSLLLPSVPTYDPWAWIIWGREVTQLDLVTTTGPSWKPLPVLFTTPFALAGDEWAPELWLVVARAGGLLAIGMAYRLGSRLAGPAAGVIAAGALLLSDNFIRDFARGNSEGLLVALCLWTIERHLDGRRRDAFLLGFAAGLLRPEVWPFWGLYGLWLVAGAWRGRRFPWRTAAIVGGAGVLMLAVWFVPEWLGSGSPLRAAERARQPNPDSAAFATSPFLEVFRRSASILMPPAYAGGVVAVLAALLARRRGQPSGVPLILAAIATVLMVGVALMTEGGFAGNLRYIALPAALVCILAGAGWVGLVRAARAHGGRVAGAAATVLALAAFVPFTLIDARELDMDMDLVAEEAAFYGEDLRAAIARAGGEQALKACPPVMTGPFHVQAVAWYLHLHGDEVVIFPLPPGTTITPWYSALARDPRFPKLHETSQWIVGRACS